MIQHFGLAQLPSLKTPIALTIGNFDGVHLGHIALLKYMHSLVDCSIVVLTFTPHPATVLNKAATPLRPLTTLEQKASLLERAGVDLLLTLPFTIEMAKKSYREFLTEIHQALPFSHLVLGEGATLGHLREGTEKKIHALEALLHFQAHYVKKATFEGEVISSGRIRKLLDEGNIALAEKLLGSLF